MQYDDQSLISKKKLLEKYSISYGALYRWKRKGLIPEEWFVKRSTSTGQETFFPKDLVCERVELIIVTKEDALLDDLARRLSGEEEVSAKLVIDTVFGEKSFLLREIKGMKKILRSGECIDLSDIIDQ